MPLYLLFFALGIIATGFFPQLPSPLFLLPLLIVLLFLRRFLSRWSLAIVQPSFCSMLGFGANACIALLLGILWGVVSGRQLLAMQLPESMSSQDWLVTGYIDSLPQIKSARVGFVFKVDSVHTLQGQSLDTTSFPSTIKLSWYRPSPSLQLVTGDYWQLRVRLKPPRGFVNPAGFDYQAWLLRRGIGAVGYVVDKNSNQLLSPPTSTWSLTRWVDKQRYGLQQWLLANSHSSERGILIALLIGDSDQLTKPQWLRMQQTGTNHLIAISGTHVGFLALFGFYLGLLIGKLLHSVWHRCSVYLVAYLCAVICCLFYSALAGFNIPTLRTALMLTLFYAMALHRRSVRGIDIYCLALAVVMIIDPLAAYDMGFWLSFGAVGLLLFYFSGRYVIKPQSVIKQPSIFNQQGEPWRGFSPRELFVGFLRSQWVMAIGLLVPLSLFIHSIALVSPIANLIAIPLITFFVVPCLLIAAGLHAVFPWLSGVFLGCAEAGMEWLKVWLDFLLRLGQGHVNPTVAFSPSIAALLAISGLLLLLPRGLFPRALGYGGIVLGLCLAFLLPKPHDSDLRITVLDVGQGTAVVIQTPEHTLVYDTGPEYSDEFDAGSAIVAPYLSSQSIRHIDTLVVSHLDKDHAGGLTGLLGKVQVDDILLGEFPSETDKNYTALKSAHNCHTQSPWQWGDVHFRFLNWPIPMNASANNRSCVLLVSYQGQTVLLPGDIEREVEQQLLASKQLSPSVTLLLAAHHGSHSSSTIGFVNTTRPRHVVYSAGYRNQHGHPHADIRERYRLAGSRAWNTAEHGALVFEWEQGVMTPVVAYREKAHRYWY